MADLGGATCGPGARAWGRMLVTQLHRKELSICDSFGPHPAGGEWGDGYYFQFESPFP